MKKKLELKKFQVAKLRNSDKINGGTGDDGTETIGLKPPKCINNSLDFEYE